MSSKLTVAQLREELKERGLDTKGLKALLVARLDQAIADEEEEEKGGAATTGTSRKRDEEQDDEDLPPASKRMKPDGLNLKMMTVANLRAELSDRGLATTGRKQELLDRLETAEQDRDLSTDDQEEDAAQVNDNDSGKRKKKPRPKTRRNKMIRTLEHGKDSRKEENRDVYAFAKVMSQKIRGEFAGRSLDSLASPTTWEKLTRPDLRGITSFNYMGCECTKTIVDFLLEEPDPEAPLIIDDGMMFVVGTPGFGKTTSLNAAFGYLYHKFANESPVTSRILHLKGKSFVAKPGPSLFRAILLAFADEDLQLDEDDYRGLIRFLECRREEKLYLLFDDGNAMDPDMKPSKAPKATPAMRDAARGNLRELSEICKTLVCASVRSYIIDSLKTDKGGSFKKFVGGFSDDERAAYLGHVGKQLSDEDLESTGSVPRLLEQFLFRPEKLRSTLSWYEEGIREYIDRALDDSQKRWEAFQMISGSIMTWDELPDVMKSRCFFQGRDKTVECLTTHLKSYALSYFASRLRLQSLSSAGEEILTSIFFVDQSTV